MSSPRSKERFSLPMVGGSSLLIIFAVLCLTIFTLLALSTAQANQRLSESSIRAVSQYYEADRQAEEIFARLRAGEMPEGVQQETVFSADTEPADPDGENREPVSTVLYSYFCPISDTQQLEVQLSRTGTQWRVLRWQAMSTAEY